MQGQQEEAAGQHGGQQGSGHFCACWACASRVAVPLLGQAQVASPRFQVRALQATHTRLRCMRHGSRRRPTRRRTLTP